MSHHTRGFTITELIVVVVLIGILTAVALPRTASTTAAISVRSSKQRVAAYLAVARSGAIQRGRVARFVRTGNTIKVLVDSASSQGTLARPIDLGSDLGVTVSATRDTIAFDPRGLAFGFTGTASIVAQRGSARDSVCVQGRGRISTVGC